MKVEPSNRNAERLAELEVAYSEWSGALLRFTIRRCGNRDDAEDVLVETYTEAYRNWDAFKGTGTRKNWLYGIAANRARMSRRKKRLDLTPLNDEILYAGSDTVDAIALSQEIARLPLNQRESFLLVKGEGITAREAAEILGRPIGTVLYDVYRAVHTLRGLLGGRDLNGSSLPCQVEP
jgi:RNA polymerase sigma-70 factor (ECF subfamily)